MVFQILGSIVSTRKHAGRATLIAIAFFALVLFFPSDCSLRAPHSANAAPGISHKNCVNCHNGQVDGAAPVVDQFRQTAHSTQIPVDEPPVWGDIADRCLSCHDTESSNERLLRVGSGNPYSTLCLTCHNNKTSTVGSSHDFSGNVAVVDMNKGVCFACHSPHPQHNAPLNLSPLWVRDLTTEMAFFNQTSDPNYTTGKSILCYDCHSGENADNDPDIFSFEPAKAPQDIAFSGDSITGTAIGFYETDPINTTPAKEADIANGAKTGGHYIKSAGSTGIQRGDKLACSDCHDLHSTANEAFIKNPLGGKAAVNLKASPTARNGSGTGREICNTCHGFGEEGVDASYTPSVSLGDVNGTYGGISKIVQRPSGVNAHRDDDSSPCTSCHRHDSISPTCDGCHTFPAGGSQGTYQGSLTHSTHVTTYGLECSQCHYSYDHNESSVGSKDEWLAEFDPNNVDVVFDPAVNPDGTTTVIQNGLDRNRQCGNLYCHGQSGSVNGVLFSALGGTNVSGNTTPTWDDQNNPESLWRYDFTKYTGACGTCHDTTKDNAAQGGSLWPIWDDTDSANDWSVNPTKIWDVTQNSALEDSSSSAHKTHLNDLKGPKVACNSCHTTPPTVAGAESTTTPSKHVNGVIDFKDGATNKAGTGVCDTCHSPGGAFDGVDDSTIGAKPNWSTGVYVSDSTLAAGKEQWCAGCHDNGVSAISDTTAPAVAGNNSTYGYFATGHGKDNMIRCTDCHDLSLEHIDGDQRTYKFTSKTQNPQAYQEGYRLQMVDADYPLVVPLRIPNIASNPPTATVIQNFRLCLKCHNQEYLLSEPGKTNFGSNGPNGIYSSNDNSPYPSPRNTHYNMLLDQQHWNPANACESCHTGSGTRNLWWDSDWDSQTYDVSGANGVDSGYSCPTCHNVHGSTFPAQINDGKLVGKDKASGKAWDGLEFSYVTSDTSNGGTWVTSNGANLTDSVGAVMRFNGDKTAGGICSMQCHLGSVAPGPSYDIASGANMTDYYRDPVITDSCDGLCHDAKTTTLKTGSHATHFTDAKGPNITSCDTCHGIGASSGLQAGHMNKKVNFAEGADTALADTSACNTCHSPGGSYDGVNDATIGAKNNWAQGVYDAGGTIVSGKEKWCASCHDESAAEIDGIAAPAVIGDEDGSYPYGNGWGFYETGHGLDSSSTYPDSGGVIQGAGKECGDCHDSSATHIDGNARTYDGGTSTDYREGYRLSLVNGSEPMNLPFPIRGALPRSLTTDFQLCYKSGCHDAEPFTETQSEATHTTNFWRSPASTPNLHYLHLNDNTLRWPSNWGATADSRMACPTCHNVHGSKRLAMVNDGSLVERTPGIKLWYNKDGITTYTNPWDSEPQPESIPLAGSDGWVFQGSSVSQMCAPNCHGSGSLVTFNRTPYQDVSQLPSLNWTADSGYISDGVQPDSGTADDDYVFRVKYTDTNNDAPSFVRLCVDRNDDGDYNDDGEKIDMAPDAASDNNYMDGRLYSKAIHLQKTADGDLTYRFESQAGTDWAIGPATSDKHISIVNYIPQLSWTSEQDYQSDGVSPDSGRAGGDFEFKVKYIDADNEAPSSIEVWVDENNNESFESGEKYAMSADLPGDTDFRGPGGKIYKKILSLAYVGDGNLDYEFHASDGVDSAQGSPTAGGIVSVTTSGGNNAPAMSWTGESGYVSDGVNPDSDGEARPFEFRVDYADGDNDAPSSMQVWLDENDNGNYDAGEKYDMTAAVAADADYSDGKLYTKTLYPAYSGDGSYKYTFRASDGVDTATGNPNNDNTVAVTNAIVVPDDTNTIQKAINAAANGSTIVVKPGIYTETVTFGGPGAGSNKNLKLLSSGGAGTTTINGQVKIQNGETSATVLDGFTVTANISSGIVYITNTQPIIKNCVLENNSSGPGLLGNNASANPTLINTTIRNCTYNAAGGGIRFTNSGSGITLDGCTIEDNTATGAGGGASFAQNANISINDTTFSGNDSTTQAGGAIYMNSGSILNITNSRFYSNRAGTIGGAVYLNSNTALNMSRTVVAGNSGTVGGAIYGNSTGSSVNAINCTFSGNRATSGNGGAIYFNNTGSTGITLTNSTLSGNRASGNGGAVCSMNRPLNIKNSILWGNHADGNDDEINCSVDPTISYTNMDRVGFAGSNGNITKAPMFVEAKSYASAPTTAGDYHINPYSQVADAGTDSGAPADDIDGQGRPQGSGYDMGSDEATSVLPGLDIRFITLVATDTSGGGPGIQAGDKVVIWFNGPTAGTMVSASTINSSLGLSGSHSWLDGLSGIGTALWSTQTYVNDTLTITLSTAGSTPTIDIGDVVSLDGSIKDTSGFSIIDAAPITGSF